MQSVVRDSAGRVRNPRSTRDLERYPPISTATRSSRKGMTYFWAPNDTPLVMQRQKSSRVHKRLHKHRQDPRNTDGQGSLLFKEHKQKRLVNFFGSSQSRRSALLWRGCWRKRPAKLTNFFSRQNCRSRTDGPGTEKGRAHRKQAGTK
jgi:hypothetical protein